MRIESLVHYAKHPSEIVPRMLVKTAQNESVPDEIALRLLYRAKIGRGLNLNNPQSFNEKLQWLKLHDRNPLYTTLVDKFAVKQWVADCIGDEYVIPTLGVWDSFGEIDFDCLPDRFVLKCTHDSGGLAICHDKASFDKEDARRRISDSLKRNFYWHAREWPYKNVRPRIIAEQYLTPDPVTGEVTDYKFMCFGGTVHCVFTCSGRAMGDLRVDFFDLGWHHLPFTRHYPNADITPSKPSRLMEMKALAERLSKGIPFVRVDFYDVAGEPRFGEMTFYPGAGLEEFTPESWDDILGDWIELPRGGIIVAEEWVLWLHEEIPENEKPCVGTPADYKLYRFTEGKIVTLVCEDRQLGKGMSETYYDENWNLLDLTEGGHPTKDVRLAPPHFEEMKEIARRLGEGMPFVRVDFYEAPQRPLFGELTFYTAAGFELFDPREWDARFGEWVDLSGAYGS